MATYNTSTNGDWNNVATWGGGGFPTINDTANIAHTVTYNIDDDVNTITAININTNGILQWSGGVGTKSLRFTNMVISGGKLIGKDGTFLRCLGSIQVDTTAGSSIEMIGSVPNYYTTTISDTAIGSGRIQVQDSISHGYGRLYNWWAASNANIAPPGWHVSTDAEWSTLVTFLGGDLVAGGKIKSTSTDPDDDPSWSSPNVGADNSSEFSSYGCGIRDISGDFTFSKSLSYYWTSTEYDSTNAALRFLANYTDQIGSANSLKINGCSIRCVFDTPLTWTPGMTVTDYDGNVYSTIKIGDQVWMESNLKTTHLNNGTAIPEITSSATWAGLSTLAQCTFNNDPIIEYLSVVSFAPGDYISVYDYSNITVWNNQNNECFIVNGVDGDYVYLRRYVGPSLTINKDTVIGTNEFYSNESVEAFSPGIKFVIDTEVFEVSSIDIYNKIIYTTTNIANAHVANTVLYETGTEKTLSSGFIVYKLATTLAAAVAAGQNYIDVKSSAGWSVGDNIAIGGTTYLYSEDRTISAIDIGSGVNGSDRLSLSPNLISPAVTNLAYAHEVDGLVIKINRDCVFHGTSANTPSSTAGFIYILSGSTNRSFRFENFEMRFFGNSGSTLYYGLVNRNTYSVLPNDLMLNISGRYSMPLTGVGSFLSYSGSYICMINNVNYQTGAGFGSFHSSYAYFSGNIVMKITTYGMYDYSGINNACEYIILSATNAQARYQIYESYTYLTSKVPNVNVPNLNLSRHRYTIFMFNHTQIEIYSPKYDNDDYAIYIYKPQTRVFYSEPYSAGVRIFNHIKISPSPTYSFATSETHPYNNSNTKGLLSQVVLLNNFNFIKGNRLIKYGYGHAEIDKSVKVKDYSWKLTLVRNNTDGCAGFFAVIEATKGTTVKIGAFIRKTSTLNGSARVELYDEFTTNAVATTTLSSNDTWQYIVVTYTAPFDMKIVARIGGWGSAGNIWVENPTIYAKDCIINTGLLSNFWINSDPEAQGMRFVAETRIR